MPRPCRWRRVMGPPPHSYFVPWGTTDHQVAILSLDQYEALRLADLEGLSQEEAAEHMGVSRPTFGRILEEAHRTVARALVYGQALRIEGGRCIIGEEHSPHGWAHQEHLHGPKPGWRCRCCHHPPGTGTEDHTEHHKTTTNGKENNGDHPSPEEE